MTKESLRKCIALIFRNEEHWRDFNHFATVDTACGKNSTSFAFAQLDIGLMASLKG